MANLYNASNNSVSLTEEIEIEIYLQKLLNDNLFMGSVLVARGEEVLLSKGYGMANLEHSISNTSQTKFRIASLTKQFTATAILKLQEKNLLDVNDSLSTYLPNYPQGKQITIHQLLNHTAGIPSFTSFEDFKSKKRMAMELDELIAWFSGRSSDFIPGDRFSYSNSGYIILTKIIEIVSDLTYADYLHYNIFKPLGMTDSGYDRASTILPNRAAGYTFTDREYQNADFIDMSIPLGAGGLYSTVEDLDKWSRSLDTDAVLSQASVDTMFAPTVEVPNEENEQIYYGYGWKIDTQHNRQRVFHEGIIDGFNTFFTRYPDERVTIVVLSNLLLSPVEKMTKSIAAIVFDESDELSK